MDKKVMEAHFADIIRLADEEDTLGMLLKWQECVSSSVYHPNNLLTRYRDVDHNLATYCAQRRLVYLLGEFLTAGLDVNIKNGLGQTALGMLIRKDDHHFAEILLANGANPDVYERGKESLLLHVLHKQDYYWVELLLKHGADVNRPSQGTLPLFVAISSRRLDLVELLLNHGADKHKLDSFGWSAETFLKSTVPSTEQKDISSILKCY